MTHREARMKIGSRVVRRAGTKTQAVTTKGGQGGGGKKNTRINKWRYPRKHAKVPTLAARVAALVKASRG